MLGVNSPGGHSGASGVSGTARPPVGGLGSDADASGIPGQALPNIADEAAAARLKAASAATKERVQTFDQGPVGGVLKRDNSATGYVTPNSAVPAKLWVSGPKGAEVAESFRKASSTMEPLHDAAAESLRREAMTAEGVIDPKKFASWQTKYQDAIRAMPAELRAKFKTAASAAQAYGEAAEARKAAMDAWQKVQVAKEVGKAVLPKNDVGDAFRKSVAGKFEGLTNDQDITRTVGGIFGAKDGVRQMRELASRVAGNPDAKEGLRKAIADHIVNLATGTTENGASGVNNLNASTFQKFLRTNAETIKAAGFSDAELGSMQTIAQDLQRSQRTLQATRLPGQSNTAQDIIKSIEKANEARPVSLFAKLMGGAMLGYEHSGVQGALGGAGIAVGEHLIEALRSAGVAKANTLVRDAMLNPELARELLKAAPIRPNAGVEHTIAQKLKASAQFGAIRAGKAIGTAYVGAHARSAGD